MVPVDLIAAAQLVKYLDEIIALIQSWPERWRTGDGAVSKVKTNYPRVREISDERLAQFDEIDGKIGGLIRLLELKLPPLCVSGNGAYDRLLGYTELALSGRWAAWPDEWERRVLSLKRAVEAILEVSKPSDGQTDSPKKDLRRMPDSPDVIDLCARLAKHAQSGKSNIQIARDFTGERIGNDRRAKSLLRQACRFRHLWGCADN